jgi:Lrp/AsnC family transcriptional regulator, leucine-responsive regulatory protein
MDKIDHIILSRLAHDGRLTFRELAEAVHLSPNAVAERFRRLVAGGAIRHIRANLDPAAFGRTVEAVVEIKLTPEKPATEFEASLRHLPQVVSATLMTGSYDYAVRVACIDRDDLVAVTETLRRHGVRDTYTRLVLREVQLGGAAA